MYAEATNFISELLFVLDVLLSAMYRFRSRCRDIRGTSDVVKQLDVAMKISQNLVADVHRNSFVVPTKRCPLEILTPIILIDSDASSSSLIKLPHRLPLTEQRNVSCALFLRIHELPCGLRGRIGFSP